MGQVDKLSHQSVAHGGSAEVKATTGKGFQSINLRSGVLVSKQQVFLAFSAVAFLVFSWAILQYLNRVTAWLFYLTVWEVIGLLGYTVLFALVESVLITAGLVVLAAVLPGFLFRQNFVPVVMVVTLTMMLGAVTFHYFEDNLRNASLPLLAAGLGVYALLTLSLYLGVQRMPRVAKQFNQVAERVSVLVYLYLPLSLIGLIIVIIRNI